MLVRARTGLRHFSTSIRDRLGIAKAEARDVDVEQAILRIIFGAAILLYAGYVALTEPHISDGLRLAIFAATCTLSAGVWSVSHFRRTKQRTAAMRYFGICSDLIPLTTGLWAAGEPGVPLIGVYLWVTVGNGFRFGPRYLLASYWLSGACFTVLLLFAPFWQSHQSIGIGFGILLATIPIYVLVLLSRLTAQKDAALELSNAKSRFVANVSHELRTPLTGVFAVYDLLVRRHLSPDEKQLVGSLGSAITTLKASVDAVLTMSKLEAGAERANPQLFNLRYFLLQMDTLTRPQALSKGLSWQLDVDGDVATTVVGDASHLQHVLGNLINNALKFTPRGGVTLRVRRAQGGIRFEVSDTGIGIPLDQQESLFERFVQADSSSTRRFGGTGLGTSIAHDLVRLMGGTIGVFSAPGKGSTFWVQLPLTAPDLSHPLPQWSDKNAILLVGYASPMRDTFIETLQSIGLVVETREPIVADAPSFKPNQYLAALLLLPAPDAAVYINAVSRDRAGMQCPWLVVTSGYTATQAAMMLKSGAVGLVAPDTRAADWHRVLAALVNRIDLPNDICSNAVPFTTANALTILLADDNHSNQLLLARILSDAGHEIRLSSRGDDAYDSLAAGGIDLAILDLNMPEMSGLDVTKLFRAGEAGTGKRLPIIMLSADATPAARTECLDAGANDFLAKPVTAEALLGMVERVAAGTRDKNQQTTRDEVGEGPGIAASKLVDHVDARSSVPPRLGRVGPLKRAPDAAAPQLVDLDRIEAIRRIANEDRGFLKKYVEAAFNDIEVAIHELRTGMDRGDARSARDALHKIDGTGASIGATALVASSKQMRAYVASTMDSDAAAALAEISTTCALTKSTVASLLHEAHSPNRPR